MRRSNAALCALRALCLLTLLPVGNAFAINPAIPDTSPVAWATGVVSITRGPNDIAVPGDGLAFFGDPLNALGPASSDPGDVVSLGDGGDITLTFSSPIIDGAGSDFAVYENGFEFSGDIFGELAYVEVSSDGTSFARFDAESLTPGPLGAFDPIDPADITNLAGAFPQQTGTGFDLLELATHPLVLSGDLDLMNVLFVRLIDVIGNGSTQDAFGNDIYDPYPTNFASGSSGFDLDAVGVLHQVPEPSIVGLLSLGGTLCALRRNRRRMAA